MMPKDLQLVICNYTDTDKYIKLNIQVKPVHVRGKGAPSLDLALPHLAGQRQNGQFSHRSNKGVAPVSLVPWSMRAPALTILRTT